jgi:hypothetical protein
MRKREEDASRDAVPLCGTMFIVRSRTEEGQVGAKCTHSSNGHREL